MINQEMDFKELPVDNNIELETPKQTEVKSEIPDKTPKLEIVPDVTEQVDTTPEISPEKEDIPDASPEKEEMPSDFIEENTVVINGKKVEIKPTKLKYFRNKAASGYGIIKAVPLHELLTYGKGVLDEKRDADQLLFDFLVAVFDNVELVTKAYDELDSETIDRICKIFGRINHIDDKEEAARKNREAQAKR